MCSLNKSSFELNFLTLMSHCYVLAYFIPEAPTETLQILDEAAKEVGNGPLERQYLKCPYVANLP